MTSAMKSYRLQEADIGIPEAWRDQTINAFVLPAGDGTGEVSFVVTRDAQTKVDTSAQFAKAQIARVSKQLNGFRLLAQEEATMDGQPCAIVDYSWTLQPKAVVCQRQGYVRWDDHFVIFTLTAKKEHFEEYKNLWGTIVQTIRFRPDHP